MSTPGLAVVASDKIATVLTDTHVYVAVLHQGTVLARGNTVQGELSQLDLVRIDDVDHCLFADNHCVRTSVPSGAVAQNVVQMFRGGSAIATSNRVRNSDPKLASISMFGQKSGRTVLGNITGSVIQIDGVDLGPPWRDLNVVAS